jgi:hypothetical protein
MSKQISFFATPSDVFTILKHVEGKKTLKYVQAGRFKSPAPIVFSRFDDIPDLGVASQESAINCTRYLVSSQATDIKPRQIASDPPYAIDQLVNPGTVIFRAGGLWKNEILISGNVGTGSNDAASLEIMKLFASAFKKLGAKVKSYYLGPEAEKLWKQGKRLTDAVQSPAEFDLSA